MQRLVRDESTRAVGGQHGDDAMMFEVAPVSLWLEDYSAVKALFDALRTAGVADLRAYLGQDPARIGACVAGMRVVRVNRRTLSRVLSQPIYRDALLFGKFLAGLATLSISLVTLWLLVIGLGLLMIGVPPGAEEIARSFVFLLVTIVYAGVWLALALLFSILFRSAATAALITLGLWLLMTFIWPVLAGAFAQIIVPPDPRYMALGLQTPGTAELEQILARLSPSTLYAEVVVALLDPTTRALGPIYLSQLQGAVLGAPLPLGESVLIAWPQIVGMIATAILLFVIGYVIFQRQEVRA